MILNKSHGVVCCVSLGACTTQAHSDPRRRLRRRRRDRGRALRRRDQKFVALGVALGRSNRVWVIFVRPPRPCTGTFGNVDQNSDNGGPLREGLCRVTSCFLKILRRQVPLASLIKATTEVPKLRGAHVIQKIRTPQRSRKRLVRWKSAPSRPKSPVSLLAR